MLAKQLQKALNSSYPRHF
uniref:Uncharacterized protein n=1 Tax=Rhizophora mucronata TaxID=61149 RepID=A0A2P2QUK5_RHIMU